MKKDKKVEELCKQLETIAKNKKCYLNPDKEFVRGIARGLLVNRKKYGYMSCPCRLASGDGKKDLDIICPCVYMPPDVKEFGMCYCALYVSKDVMDGKIKVHSIPERRPNNKKKLS
jgi:ferredoxin-thioredoxin reductase catalytic subunit